MAVHGGARFADGSLHAGQPGVDEHVPSLLVDWVVAWPEPAGLLDVSEAADGPLSDITNAIDDLLAELAIALDLIVGIVAGGHLLVRRDEAQLAAWAARELQLREQKARIAAVTADAMRAIDDAADRTIRELRKR